MASGQSRKWIILVATLWIQSFTGTNFDFSSYSSELKSVLGISQVELNYLAVASDMGKVFGWSSGLALMYLPLSVVLFIAAFMGCVGYGFQWLVITQVISLPYFLVFLLCLLAGCSICWFNTVCFVLCIKNFPSNRPLALSLTVGFNGISAAIYTLAANSVDSSSASLYLFLNALLPLLVSLAALLPIHFQPSPLDHRPQPESVLRDSLIFLLLNVLAVLTGTYLLLFASSTSRPRLLFCGALFLLFFPLLVPGVLYAREWFNRKLFHSRLINLEAGSGFILVDETELELHKELLVARRGSGSSITNNGSLLDPSDEDDNRDRDDSLLGQCGEVMMGRDKLAMLGEEHSAKALVKRLDFWLYYAAYFCGGTIGLVFSNNLGQIAQSLGQSSETTTLVTLYSSFSFFGRLLSAAPDYIRAKLYFARTGWLMIALVPTPIAFIILASSGSTTVALQVGTALVGLSSGFIFAAAVSITSELFGPNSFSVNHNILITNIPLGSLLYGLLAAIVYDSHGNSTGAVAVVRDFVTDSIVCMGTDCYFFTFVWWGCISFVGLVSSLMLFLRTRHAYDHFEHSRTTQLY